MFDRRKLDRGPVSADDHQPLGGKALHALGESTGAHRTDHDQEFIELLGLDRMLEGTTEDLSDFA